MIMSLNDDQRYRQIRRRWDCDVKYRRPGDPDAAELHEFVTDLLNVIDDAEELADHVCESDDPYADLDPSGDISWEEHNEEMAELAREHTDRMGELAPAIEELHNQAHGAGSLYMCSIEPCRSLYRVLPNARGVVLAPLGSN